MAMVMDVMECRIGIFDFEDLVHLEAENVRGIKAPFLIQYHRRRRRRIGLPRQAAGNVHKDVPQAAVRPHNEMARRKCLRMHLGAGRVGAGIDDNFRRRRALQSDFARQVGRENRRSSAEQCQCDDYPLEPHISFHPTIFNPR